MKPRALDLFCGAGGASVGLAAAGFDVVGVDIKNQPRYPFPFFKADATTFPLYEPFGSPIAFVWASPPCQRFSDLGKRNGNAHEWPDLIEPMRQRLRFFKGSWAIENVEGAPLINPVMLCGTMFPGLRVLRHRLFECSFPVVGLPHGKHPLVHTRDKRKSHYGKTDDTIDFVQVTGGGNSTIKAARDAMGINWMTKAEINEAIPPAYAEYVGCAALAHIRSAANAA